MPLDANTTSLDSTLALSPASTISDSTGMTWSTVSCPWSEQTTSSTSLPRSRIRATAAMTAPTFASDSRIRTTSLPQAPNSRRRSRSVISRSPSMGTSIAIMSVPHPLYVSMTPQFQ